MAKKVQFPCKIQDYINDIDAELGELMDVVCAPLGSRGKPGLTFLRPDKSLADEIKKLAYSSNMEEVVKARDILSSLILGNCYNKGTEMRDDKFISNALHPSQQVFIKEASGDSVTFANSAGEAVATAKLDTAFKPIPGKRLAVWVIDKKLPLSSPVATRRPMEDHRKMFMDKKNKTGSFDQSTANQYNQELRWKIMIAIENIYALDLQQAQTSGCCGDDVYFKYEASLLAYLCKNENRLFRTVMPMVSFDNVDLYFLIEPVKAAGNTALISDEILQKWWMECANYKHCCANCGANCTKVAEYLKETSTFRKGVLERVNDVRLEMSKDLSGIDIIAIAYDEISGSGTLHGKPFFQENGTFEYYNSDKDLKLIQDELRFTTAFLFAKLEQSKFDIGQFKFITNYIVDVLHSDKARIINTDLIKRMIQPMAQIQRGCDFAKSSWLLYIPHTKAERQADECYRPYLAEDNVSRDFAVHARVATEYDQGLIIGMLNADPDFAERVRKQLM